MCGIAASRALQGHRSSVSCLDLHPFGDAVTTGSMDTSVRIWDLRSRSALFTFKAHNSPITAVAHSPDGRWLCSGDSSGVVRLFDVSNGRELANLTPDCGGEPIVSLTFSPTELLLSIVTEHHVIFSDLEQFTTVSISSREAQSLRASTFTSEATHFLTASSDFLKAWQWEPRCTNSDTLECAWGSVCDLVAIDDFGEDTPQLYAVSKQRSVVTVWSVDLSFLQLQQHSQTMSDDATLASPPQQSRQTVRNAPNPAFFAAHNIPNPVSPRSVMPSTSLSQQQQQQTQHHPPPQLAPLHVPQSSSASSLSRQISPKSSAASNRSLPAIDNIVHSLAQPVRSNETSPTSRISPHSSSNSILTELPDSADWASSLRSDHDLIAHTFALRLQSARQLVSQCQTLSTPSQSLSLTLDRLLQHSDCTVIITALDALQSLILQQLTLDCAIPLLQLCSRILGSELHRAIERHVTMSVQLVESVCQHFGSLFLSAATTPKHTIAPGDLHQQERLEKCQSCIAALRAIHPSLQHITQSHTSDPTTQRCSQLLRALQPMLV